MLCKVAHFDCRSDLRGSIPPYPLLYLSNKVKKMSVYSRIVTYKKRFNKTFRDI